MSYQKLSEEESRVVRALPCCTNLDPLHTPFHQTLVMTAPTYKWI